MGLERERDTNIRSVRHSFTNTAQVRKITTETRYYIACHGVEYRPTVMTKLNNACARTSSLSV